MTDAAAQVSSPTAADAIDGVMPGTIAEPETWQSAAATLAWASARGQSVVLRGSGTKIGWGRRVERIDLLLSTRRMNRVLAHRAGDLTVSVEAGITLGELNAELGAHGQWLPLDPPFAARATVGGILATNDSGPLRHRYGTPRDLVIGIQLATTDGRLARAGGQVVKNVAGYDLSRLAAGSFGSLAAIVGATFKLSPLPRDWTTVVVETGEPAPVGRLATLFAASQLEPAAFEVRGECSAGAPMTTTCLLRFSGGAALVDAQVAGVRSCADAVAAPLRIVTGDEERALWAEHGSHIWQGDGAVVRASWLPGESARVLVELERLARRVSIVVAGRVGSGAGLIRLDGPEAEQVALIASLRSSAAVGNVVIVRAAPAVKSAIDVWGTVANARLLQSVKRAVDPAGTLGAGRGPM